MSDEGLDDIGCLSGVDRLMDERLQKELIFLINDIISGLEENSDNERFVRMATSTMEFQRLLHFISLQDMNESIINDKNGSSSGMLLSEFEKELFSIAKNFDTNKLEKIFEFAPLHIKLKMVELLDVRKLARSEDDIVLDCVVRHISDNCLHYDGVIEDLKLIDRHFTAKKDDNDYSAYSETHKVVSFLIEDFELNNQSKDCNSNIKISI